MARSRTPKPAASGDPAGRTTPARAAKGAKGVKGAKGAKGARGGGRVTQKGSGRYTPPVPRESKVSPAWVPALMFTCLGLGMVTIISNYVSLLPGGTNNWYLLVGLGLITLGFITATRYH